LKRALKDAPDYGFIRDVGSHGLDEIHKYEYHHLFIEISRNGLIQAVLGCGMRLWESCWYFIQIQRCPESGDS
jgi:hypothetical protein